MIRWFPRGTILQEGAQARADGVPLHANPYPGSGVRCEEESAVAWMEGWDQRDRQIAAEH